MLVKQAFSMARGRVIKVGIFSGIVNVLTLSGSIYMLQVYDRVLPTRSFPTLIGLSMILLAAYILQGFFDALRVRMLTRIGALFDQSLQRQIHDCMLALRLRGWDTAAVTQPIRDLEVIRMFLSGMGPTAFLDLPWVPLFLIVLLFFHPIIAAGAAIGMGLIVGFTFIVEYSTKKHAAEVNKLGALRGAMAQLTAYNAEAIHALGMSSRFGNKWRAVNTAYIREILAIRDIEADIGTMAKMLRYVLQSAILGLGAALVITDQATAGIMIASSIVMGRALAPIEIVLGTWKQFAMMREAFKRLTGMLTANAATDSPALALPRPAQSLAVNGLYIVPPGFKHVVAADITFELAPGMGLAVVGASGSGKSSLARTLVGVWKPYQGTVSLDGAHIDQWDSDLLGRYMGYMPQDVALFDGTIAENIARFEKTPSDADIIEAAKTAGAHDLILSWKGGYSRRIGENGGLLSAGQRQRIALARACYGDPFLIVLDEPNASLDSEGERVLSEAILRLRKRGCIVVCISHRIATLAALDMAMIMTSGRVLAFGPRDEVLAAAAGAPPPPPEGGQNLDAVNRADQQPVHREDRKSP
jgi:PrtD family type I secretion system ABC transporter